MSGIGGFWATLEVATEEGREKLRGRWAKRFAVVMAVAMLTTATTMMVLPDEENNARASHVATGEDICAGAPDTHYYDIVALEVDVVYNNWGDHDPDGRIFVLEQNKDELLDQVENNPGEPASLARPLAIRAHIGDCVVMNLTNELPNPASLHVHGVIAQPGQGTDLGTNGPDLTDPNETRTYKVRIPDDPAMEGAHFLHSHASPRFQTQHGLFGAVVVAEQKGTSWQALDGSPMDSGIAATILDPDGPDFREFVVIYHDEIEVLDENDDELPTVSPFGEYGPGTKGINLRTEPFLDRFEFHEQLNAEGKAPSTTTNPRATGATRTAIRPPSS